MTDELGVPTPTPTPQSFASWFRGLGFDEKVGRFLKSEEAALSRLIGFYQQASNELLDFLRYGNRTQSDEDFYTALMAQADLAVEKLNAGATSWTANTLPTSYMAGAVVSGGSDFVFRPVHDDALRALSGYSLDLIVDTNEDIRRNIQQAIASSISTGITRDETIRRILASGLTSGPWKDVATRAAVIARTETMRAYNAGNIAAIRDTGGVAGEWHTSRDERVCPVCGPLDGRAFILPGVTADEARAAGVPLSWPHLLGVGARGNVLKVPPRHPRCRCTLRARYRDDQGRVFRPSLPDPAADVAGAQEIGTMAASAGVQAWPPEVAASLNTIESDIVRNPGFETLVYVNPQTGEEIMRVGGAATSVNITPDMTAAGRGMILTHNHPRGHGFTPGDPRWAGNSFSPDDVNAMLLDKYSAIRAIGPGWMHTLRALGDIPDPNEIIFRYGQPHVSPMGEFRRIAEDVRRQFAQEIAAGTRKIASAESEHWHVVMERWIARMKDLGFDFDYVREPVPDIWDTSAR